MTYSAVDRRLSMAVVMAHSSTTNDSVSVGGKVPLDTLSDMIGSASSTLSVGCRLLVVLQGIPANIYC